MTLFIDPNNVDFRLNQDSGGSITAVHSAPHISFSGEVNSAAGNTVLVLDAAMRFVAACPLHAETFSFQTSDFILKTMTWPLQAYLYTDRLNTAVPMNDVPSPTGGSAEAVPTFRSRYKEAVVDALKHKYSSTSSEGGIKTGNGYQSVDLDDLDTLGGRPHRNVFFDHIDFKGKTVLDIGANTGELSRLARHRGADLVDGYEYDPFFVETGRMINGALGMTRVSLFQGDATQPVFYERKKYDIVLTFSVWVYTHKMLDRLADVTDVVFFETHTLDHGIEMYIEPMTKHFPFFKVVGYDINQDMRKSRGVLVFAKTEAQLNRTLMLPSISTEMYCDHDFFDKWGRTTPDQLSQFVEKVWSITSKLSKPRFGFGTQYFEFFLAGYHEYLKSGSVTVANIFAKNYRKAIEEGRLDGNLKHLVKNDELLIQKVASKFTDIDNITSGNHAMVAPPTIRPGNGDLRFRTIGGRKFSALDVDGHHRLFIYQLLGYPSVEVLMRENLPSKQQTVNTAYVMPTV